MAQPTWIRVCQGANLPHWTKDGATYAVTFRLADSLPEHAVEKLRSEHARIDRKFDHGQPLSIEELVAQSKAKSEAYLRLLDECYGECHMRKDDVAEVVAGALKHFDGQRYKLFAWCVMPNHVHAVLQPLQGFELPAILHSWKSFTANRANKILGRSGPFWQSESYDHLIRDDADLEHQIWYTRENPRAARLKDWKWVG